MDIKDSNLVQRELAGTAHSAFSFQHEHEARVSKTYDEQNIRRLKTNTTHHRPPRSAQGIHLWQKELSEQLGWMEKQRKANNSSS